MCMEECKSLSSVVICNTTCINGNCLHQGELIKCIANFLTRYVGNWQGAYNVKRAGECGSYVAVREQDFNWCRGCNAILGSYYFFDKNIFKNIYGIYVKRAEMATMAAEGMV